MEFTLQEKQVLEKILFELKFCSKWNEEVKKYTDHEKFKIMINFSQEEFESISSILKKIKYHD